MPEIKRLRPVLASARLRDSGTANKQGQHPPTPGTDLPWNLHAVTAGADKLTADKLGKNR
jgi:hypothetical protein